MKKTLYLMLALMLCGIVGCKPSEKNYRAAYEKTMARDSLRTDFDQTIYGRYRRQVRDIELTNANGDTVEARTMRVVVTQNGGGVKESLKKYCVVVAEFKQLLNANSMRTRFNDGGYPGAFVVHTAEPFYYVLAGSFDNLSDAESLVATLRQKSPVALKAPAPYILIPSQIK